MSSVFATISLEIQTLVFHREYDRSTRKVVVKTSQRLITSHFLMHGAFIPVAVAGVILAPAVTLG
jgi:ribosomal protein L25 (general stress protein Ctc)